MPNISSYLLARFGIAVYMYPLDVGQHNLPHVHLRCEGEWAVVEVPSGRLLDGDLPSRKMRKAQAWIELHEAELMERWADGIRGKKIKKVD